MADLLSIPTGDRYPPLNLSPQKRKEKILHAQLAQLKGLAARQPPGEPAKSIHQVLAKDQNAARWQPRPATALSEKAAWNAPAHVHAPSGA